MHSAFSRQRSWLRVVLLVAAIATTGAAHSTFNTTSHAKSGKLRVPSPEYARLWSLGGHRYT